MLNVELLFKLLKQQEQQDYLKYANLYANGQ